MKTRTAVVWLVLERMRGSYGHVDVNANARVVRTSRNRPRLGLGQVAVRVVVTVDDNAFEPVFKPAEQVVAPDHVLRAATVETKR